MNGKNVLIRISTHFLVIFLVLSTSGFTHKPVHHPGSQADPPTISGTITLWYGYGAGSSEETALLTVINNARIAYPLATINIVQKDGAEIFNDYQTAVESGGGPDLFIYTNDALASMVDAGVVQNLDSFLAGRLANVQQTAIDGMKVNGILYGVPESSKVVALYYNKSAITTPPDTTANLLALVLSGKKLVLFSGNAGGQYYNYGFFSAFGGQLMDSNHRCIANHGGYAPAMHYLLDLKTAGATVIDDGWAQGDVPFENGSNDMVIDGPWLLMDFESALGANLGVVSLPLGPSGMARPFNGIDGYFVNPNSTNQASAIELALYATSQASSQIMMDTAGHIPIRTDITFTDPLIQAFAVASAQGEPRPQVLELGNYWSPFGDMFNQVLTGTISPEVGIRIACNTMNDLNGFPTYLLNLPLIHR